MLVGVPSPGEAWVEHPSLFAGALPLGALPATAKPASLPRPTPSAKMAPTVQTSPGLTGKAPKVLFSLVFLLIAQGPQSRVKGFLIRIYPYPLNIDKYLEP